MGRKHKSRHGLTVLSWLLWLLLSPGCNWLSQGTGKIALVRAAATSPKPTFSKVQAGAIALGEGITSELSTNLITAGLAPSEAQVVVDSSQAEIVAAAGQISIQTLALAEGNPLTFVAGPAVRGAIKALDEPGVNLADPTGRAAIAQVVMSSTVGSLGGRTDGLSTDQVLSLQKDMVGTGVKSLNDASLGGDQAANAVKALTTGAAASLSKSVDSTAAAAAAASIVSGAVESITAAGISTDLIQSVVGSAVEGVVAQLSKTGVRDAGEAASLVAKSSVESLKVLALPVEKIIEATEGAAKGAVSALTAAGVSKEAIANAAQKVASSSATALKTAGVPDDSVGKAAGAIASGAIQGLGAAGLTASEIAASKSVSAIVSGASSGVAASGMASDKISSALGDVAGTAITSIAKLAKTTSGDVTAIQSQVVSEVIQSTIAQAITVGVATSGNISSITATIATGAGQGLASLSRSGVTVTSVQTVIQQATVQVLTEQKTKIGIDSSTITSVATSAGQTAQATKTAEIAKTSGTTLAKCAATYPDAWSDAEFKAVVEPMTTMPSCERDTAGACPKKRLYPEVTASWIAIANSNICQFNLQKLSDTAMPNNVTSCPAQLLGPVAVLGLTEVFSGDRYLYACRITQGLCPPAPFDANIISSQVSGVETCLYGRKFELAKQLLFYPPSGSYSGPQNFWISAPKGATVYVTDNGTTPSATNGTVYSGESFVLSSNKTIRAVGTVNGTSLPEVNAAYVITGGGEPDPFTPTASCAAVAVIQNGDSSITFEKWNLLSLHPNSPSIRGCLKGTPAQCPHLHDDLQMDRFYGPWMTGSGEGATCVYQEAPHCSELFPGKSTLSKNDLMASPLTNQFMDLTCTAPTADSCIPLMPGSTGYTFTQGQMTANGRYFCDYSRDLAPCDAIYVHADAESSLVTAPLGQNAFNSMSLPEKPFSFERACQLANTPIDDLRFPVVDEILKSQGYYALSTLDAGGRKRIAFYKETPDCPASPITSKDLMHVDLIDKSGKLACEIPPDLTCPFLDSELISKFTVSTEVYSSTARKRCVLTPQTSTCSSPAYPFSESMMEVLTWNDSVFLCNIAAGTCPTPIIGLSRISSSVAGPQTCAYAWTSFLAPPEDLTITVTPFPGTYNSNQNVVLVEPTGATIHYTTDGSVPTFMSPIFTDSILVSSSTIINAIAVRDNYTSPLISATYTILQLPNSTPPCSSLPLLQGYMGEQAWFAMEFDPAQPSKRRCLVAAGTLCPALSSDLLARDARGPMASMGGTGTQCGYEEPHHCENIFPGLSFVSSSIILASPFKNAFGDVSCTKPVGEACLPLDQANLSHVAATGHSLPDGRSYCHYTYLNTNCPASMVANAAGNIMTMLSNPITDTIKSALDPIIGSMEFAYACRPQTMVKYPIVDQNLAEGGYYAEFQGVPGTSRIVLRQRAPKCPMLANGTPLGLDDLQMMPFVENRGIKACEAPTLADCPSLTGGNASSVYYQMFTSYMIGSPATSRCEYGLINPVSCPAGSLSVANLTFIDDVFNPLYACQIPSGTCPAGEPDFRLITANPNGPQRCVYEPKPNFAQSCFAIKTAQPGASSGIYTIDPDGADFLPPFNVYCDMETDGGGWTLVGRGRENWAWDENGKNIDIVTTGVGTPDAFVPAYLPSMTINRILGIDGSNVVMSGLADGVRIKRSLDTQGTTYQEIRWKYSNLTFWSWIFDAYDVGYGLSSFQVDQTISYGNHYTRDTDLNANDASRVFTWAWDMHGYARGFSYGVSVSTGTLSANNFLWQIGAEQHSIPYTEVYVRH